VLIGLNVMSGAITKRFANGVEALSRLVPAGVGIAFSLVLVRFVFNLEGVLTQALKSVFSNVDVASVIPPASSWLDTLVLFLGLGIGLVIAKSVAPLTITILGNGITIGAFIAVAAEIGIYGIILKFLPSLILVVFAMALCVQILMRIVLINFFVIISPLAIVASVLPGREGVSFTRNWMLGFFSLLASHFSQVIVLLLGLILLNAVDVKVHFGIIEVGLVQELIKYGVLSLMLRVPSLFRSTSTMLISQMGSSAAGVVSGPYLAFM
jgi:hypothetical protein